MKIQQGNTQNDLSTIVSQYLDKGWQAPLPLPHNAKFPPPKGVTGNIPPLERAEVIQLWASASTDSNIAVRAQIDSSMEVIFIDVDEDPTKGKHGKREIENLMEQLGDLNLQEIPRSSRRGVDSPAVQYPFLVPKGKKWVGSAGSSIDIIQLTHRYTAVWPSVVDGMQYQWYIGNQVVDIPHIDDLPTLPDKWVNYLSNGTLSLRNAPRRDYDLSDNLAWLEASMVNYDHAMDRAFQDRLATAKEDFRSNGHDTMNDTIHWAVRYAAVDGHPGLKPFLDGLREAFVREISTRRGASEFEFDSNLSSDIDLLRGQVRSGEVKLAMHMDAGSREDLDELDVMQSSRTNVQSKLEEVRELLARTKGADLQAASLLAMCYPELIVRRSSHIGRKDDLTIYNTRTGYILAKTDLVVPYNERVQPILKDLERALEVPDEADADALKSHEATVKFIQMLQGYAGSARNLGSLESMSLAAITRTVDARAFDRDDNIVGIKGRTHVIDLSNGDLRVRPRTVDDLVTKETFWSMEDLREGIAALQRGEQPNFKKVLSTIMPDREHSHWFARALGYGMHGDNAKRVFVLLWGEPGRGKGTFMSAYQHFLGDYYASGSLEAVSKRGDENNSSKAAMLRARVAVMSEANRRSEGQASALKEISGNDEVAVTDKYQATEMHNGTTLILQTNHAPKIAGEDAALRDRVLPIPFEGQRERVQALMAEIDDAHWFRKPIEVAAMFQWLRRGFRESQGMAFVEDEYSPTMVKMLDAFMTAANPVRGALEDVVVVTGKSDDWLAGQKILSEIHHIDGGELAGTKLADIREVLEDLGAIEHRMPHGRGFKGVRFKSQDERLADSRPEGWSPERWVEYNAYLDETWDDTRRTYDDVESL